MCRSDQYLNCDRGVCAEHHLQSANVALGAIRYKDLICLAANMGIEPVTNGLPNFWLALLRSVPAPKGTHFMKEVMAIPGCMHAGMYLPCFTGCTHTPAGVARAILVGEPRTHPL